MHFLENTLFPTPLHSLHRPQQISLDKIPLNNSKIINIHFNQTLCGLIENVVNIARNKTPDILVTREWHAQELDCTYYGMPPEGARVPCIASMFTIFQRVSLT